MNVAAVQQHIRDLTTLVKQAGAAEKVINELTAVAGAFEPFRNHRLDQFSEFLKRAEEFDRTKVLPVVPQKPTRVTRTPAAPKSDPNDAVLRVKGLYNDILDPNLGQDRIDTELALVDGLKKAHLQQLAEAVGIWEKVKKSKVGDIAGAVKKAIQDRRGMFHRPHY